MCIPPAPPSYHDVDDDADGQDDYRDEREADAANTAI